MNWESQFKIANRAVGENSPVFIIAEAGVAHFGSLEKAFRLVDLAVDAGADAIKFQIYRTQELISSVSPEWQERMQPKELSLEYFKKIKVYCDNSGIIFFATAHDELSLDDLIALEAPVYKIGSGELKNWRFLTRIAEIGKPVILSTGMYTLEDIGEALEAFGKTGNRELAVLHCVTAYPTPPSDVNLLAIRTISEAFKVVTGYSDHTQGFHFPITAVALGAKIVEKHISMDFNVPNAQDWKVSCGPHDLHLMIRQIREVEAGLGNGEKIPGPAEMQSIVWARKSLVASRNIKAGHRISPEDIKFKRPGTGIPPSEVDQVIGKETKEAIPFDAIIRWEQLT